MFWIIIGCILLILLIAFFSPVKITVEYLNNKPKIILKYLFIRKNLSDFRKPDNKTDKKITKSDEKEKKSKKSSRKKKIIPDDFSGKIAFFKNLAIAGGKALRRITWFIKIKDIYIDFTVSDLDAYECALKFGKTNIIVYNILSYLGYFIKLKKKSINIRCVYNQPDCIYNLKFKVCLTPIAAIAALIAFFVTFLVNNKKAERSLAKS